MRWLERTPDYISHLKSLDLVVIGPSSEDESLREKYEMLETHRLVGEADELAEATATAR